MTNFIGLIIGAGSCGFSFFPRGDSFTAILSASAFCCIWYWMIQIKPSRIGAFAYENGWLSKATESRHPRII